MLGRSKPDVITTHVRSKMRPTILSPWLVLCDWPTEWDYFLGVRWHVDRTSAIRILGTTLLPSHYRLCNLLLEITALQCGRIMHIAPKSTPDIDPNRSLALYSPPPTDPFCLRQHLRFEIRSLIPPRVSSHVRDLSESYVLWLNLLACVAMLNLFCGPQLASTFDFVPQEHEGEEEVIIRLECMKQDWFEHAGLICIVKYDSRVFWERTWNDWSA